jgi:CPA2 family monovalent cation:H+ antiporter-2
VFGNAFAAFGMAYLLRAALPKAATVGASLSQIGEFSFILAGLGVSLKLLPDLGRDFILAGAILSILVNPLMFHITERLNSWLSERNIISAPASPPEPQLPVRTPTTLSGHAILIGHGRVGRSVAEVLLKNGQALLIVEERKEIADQLRAKGNQVIEANAVDPGLLEATNVAAARWLITAIPNALESGSIIEQARALNPNLQIIARAHSDEEVQHLTQYGANLVIMGEREIARGITSYLLDQIKTADKSTDYSGTVTG